MHLAALSVHIATVPVHIGAYSAYGDYGARQACDEFFYSSDSLSGPRVFELASVVHNGSKIVGFLSLDSNEKPTIFDKV